MAAGDEMSIACGELSGMARYVCGVGMSMDVDGIESRVSLQTIELNGSTVLLSLIHISEPTRPY